MLARNLKFFEDKETFPLKCVVQFLNILNAYPLVQKNVRINAYFRVGLGLLEIVEIFSQPLSLSLE